MILRELFRWFPETGTRPEHWYPDAIFGFGYPNGLGTEADRDRERTLCLME